MIIYILGMYPYTHNIGLVPVLWSNIVYLENEGSDNLLVHGETKYSPSLNTNWLYGKILQVLKT